MGSNMLKNRVILITLNGTKQKSHFYNAHETFKKQQNNNNNHIMTVLLVTPAVSYLAPVGIVQPAHVRRPAGD